MVHIASIGAEIIASKLEVIAVHRNSSGSSSRVLDLSNRISEADGLEAAKIAGKSDRICYREHGSALAASAI